MRGGRRVVVAHDPRVPTGAPVYNVCVVCVLLIMYVLVRDSASRSWVDGEKKGKYKGRE